VVVAAAAAGVVAATGGGVAAGVETGVEPEVVALVVSVTGGFGTVRNGFSVTGGCGTHLVPDQVPVWGLE